MPVPSKAQPSNDGPHDPETVRQVLDKLNELLKQSDITALAFLDEHAGLLRSAFLGGGEELAQQIRRFDFETAEKTLHALQKEVGAVSM
jgi:hypothetical protein